MGERSLIIFLGKIVAYDVSFANYKNLNIKKKTLCLLKHYFSIENLY